MTEAIGTYRTLQGSGLRSANEVRSETVTDENGEERQVQFVVHQWDGFERGPDGWAAYDKNGFTWRVSAEEAEAIKECLA